LFINQQYYNHASYILFTIINAGNKYSYVLCLMSVR